MTRHAADCSKTKYDSIRWQRCSLDFVLLDFELLDYALLDFALLDYIRCSTTQEVDAAGLVKRYRTRAYHEYGGHTIEALLLGGPTLCSGR